MDTDDIARALDGSELHHLPLYKRRDVVEFVVRLVAEALARGEEVRLANLGVLHVKHFPERQGRNISTRELQMYPPKNVVKFRAHKALKDAVNRPEELRVPERQRA